MTAESGVGERMAQYTTFVVAGRLYGIDVTRVQEVVRPLPMTRIPLAAPFVRGLVNLRGQVATALGLRELFQLDAHPDTEAMNVVCRSDGHLFSLLVDDIGDVTEISDSRFEQVPRTIPEAVRKYLSGVYKLNSALLTIIDTDKIIELVNK